MVFPADKLAALQKSYGQQCYFQILSTFHMTFVGHWPANSVWWQAKASDFMDRYIY